MSDSEETILQHLLDAFKLEVCIKLGEAEHCISTELFSRFRTSKTDSAIVSPHNQKFFKERFNAARHEEGYRLNLCSCVQRTIAR